MDAAVKNLTAASSEKAKALQVALAQIEKQFGKGTIMRLGEGEVIEDIQVVSTGKKSAASARLSMPSTRWTSSTRKSWA
jgi:hypothetical protein